MISIAGLPTNCQQQENIRGPYKELFGQWITPLGMTDHQAV
jgi:hypothetical protein